MTTSRFTPTFRWCQASRCGGWPLSSTWLVRNGPCCGVAREKVPGHSRVCRAHSVRRTCGCGLVHSCDTPTPARVALTPAPRPRACRLPPAACPLPQGIRLWGRLRMVFAAGCLAARVQRPHDIPCPPNEPPHGHSRDGGMRVQTAASLVQTAAASIRGVAGVAGLGLEGRRGARPAVHAPLRRGCGQTATWRVAHLDRGGILNHGSGTA